MSASNGDIAGFGGNPGFYAVTPTTRVASGDTAPSVYGIGMAVIPSGKYLFASLDNSESIETFKITPSPCKLTPAHNLAGIGDQVGPLAVSSDGKVLIVPGPNNSFVNAYAIAPNGSLALINPSGTICTVTTLPCSIDLTTTVQSNCPTVGVGCYPTGIDISQVIGGNATVALGNATVAGPYYITCSLNTSPLFGLSACNTQPITGPGAALANIESPFYNKAGYSGATTAGIYFGASGFGTGYPAGVSLNPVAVGGGVTAASTAAYVNPAAYYASNAQDFTNGAIQYVWQSGVTSAAVNTMYLYKWNGIVFVSVGGWPKSLANPNAHGTSYVLSLQALNQAGMQTR
jgi:hypothetical protein